MSEDDEDVMIAAAVIIACFKKSRDVKLTFLLL